MPLSQTKKFEEATKPELVKTAQALDVEGRSTMTKDELAGAVAASGATVSDVLGEIAVLWSTVGHDTVNDQPVKSPTAEEFEKLEELLGRATKYVKTAKKARA